MTIKPSRMNFRDTLRNSSFMFLKFIPLFLSFIAFSVLLFEFGFKQDKDQQFIIDNFFLIFFVLEICFLFIRYFIHGIPGKKEIIIVDLFILSGMVISMSGELSLMQINLLDYQMWKGFLILLIFIREFSNINIVFKRSVLNPAQIFMASFMLIIIIGSLFLTFPNATYKGISFVDALFTSTSAVCVTGLSSVDTGTTFTVFGQVTIMMLIQIGGLGIMTFTSYFSYFFTGESSYENQLVMQEMTNSDKMVEVFSTLKRVLVLTFVVEFIGAISIFLSLDTKLIPDIFQRIYFSVFHAVSGFCNAGFSTLSNNLYDINYRFNYPFQLTIAFLIIFGGIGFPIMFNMYKYILHLFKDVLFRKKHQHYAWLININTRIVFITTFFLLVFGTTLFYIFEYNNVLAEHHGFGKVVTAFFGAVTPRTAGFNSVDNSVLNMSTVLLIYFLMWVGASPSSTGGGIKTTTFAISLMNSISLARGKDRIEIYGREISDMTVRRAYSQILLSLIAIGLSVFLVCNFNRELDLRSVVFESISAFGTVGLSLGITAKLSVASKYVIIATMFIGRINLLTIITAFMKQVRFRKYRYPSEDILIN